MAESDRDQNRRRHREANQRIPQIVSGCAAGCTSSPSVPRADQEEPEGQQNRDPVGDRVQIALHRPGHRDWRRRRNSRGSHSSRMAASSAIATARQQTQTWGRAYRPEPARKAARSRRPHSRRRWRNMTERTSGPASTAPARFPTQRRSLFCNPCDNNPKMAISSSPGKIIPAPVIYAFGRPLRKLSRAGSVQSVTSKTSYRRFPLHRAFQTCTVCNFSLRFWVIIIDSMRFTRVLLIGLALAFVWPSFAATFPTSLPNNGVVAIVGGAVGYRPRRASQPAVPGRQRL